MPIPMVAAGPTVAALQKATSTIPIVMTGSGDPVAQGLVQSLARPGGNVTGLTLQSVDTVGKRIELLGEVIRPTGPIAVLWGRYSLLQWKEAEAAAKASGWKLLSLEIGDGRAVGRGDAVLHQHPGHAPLAARVAGSRGQAAVDQRVSVDGAGRLSDDLPLEPRAHACGFHTPRCAVHRPTRAVTSDAPNALLTSVGPKRVAQALALAKRMLKEPEPRSSSHPLNLEP
jgi:hypothetical protein